MLVIKKYILKWKNTKILPEYLKISGTTNIEQVDYINILKQELT